MKRIYLDPLSAAKQLTAAVLNEADNVYPDSHTNMQAEFHLRNCVFNRS